MDMDMRIASRSSIFIRLFSFGHAAIPPTFHMLELDYLYRG
jgi:hypothetical protein